jgi:hypothetical protein
MLQAPVGLSSLYLFKGHLLLINFFRMINEDKDPDGQQHSVSSGALSVE